MHNEYQNIFTSVACRCIGQRTVCCQQIANQLYFVQATLAS